MITILGDTQTITRVQTGFWSFDRAFMNRKGASGFPVRAMCELYGKEGIGKSTTAYCLSARIATALNTNIALADLEMFDPETVQDMLDNAGYCGTLRVVEGETDEKVLDALVKSLREPEFNVGILDSLGAISPIAETDGHSGDRNMGQRALLAAQLSRRVIHAFRMKQVPSVLFITNHQMQKMGSRFSQGTTTSGGEVKKYLACTRLSMFILKKHDDGSSLLKGKVEKNRFGFGRRVFYLFNLAGWGIHPGLTAVTDCIFTGLAKEERTIKLDGKSYGFFSKMIENASDVQLFEPFQQTLKDYNGEVRSNKGADDDTDDETED